MTSMDRKESVKYDGTAWDGKPMRTSKAADPDFRAVLGLARHARVDIVPESNGSHWYGDAVLISYESAGDMGCVRFTVELPNGKRVKVAQDRIRPAR